MGALGGERDGPYPAGVVWRWLVANYNDFDGWCSAHGLDPFRLNPQSGLNAYLFAIREYADKELRERIDEALEPPNRWDALRQAPTWWVDDEDAWSGFANAPRV